MFSSPTVIPRPTIDAAPPLTYLVRPGEGGWRLALQPVDAAAVPADAWTQLAANISAEPSLVSYTQAELVGRWQAGRAAVAMVGTEIVAYISLIPILNAETWPSFRRAAGLQASDPPAISVQRSATGWTHPVWRRKGLSRHLRVILLDRFSCSTSLFISIARGVGASYVLAKLGWQLVAWRSLPFLTGLIGAPATGLDAQFAAQLQPVSLTPYQGGALALARFSQHAWSGHCHFWMSDPALAVDLDAQLTTLLDHDLPRWRNAVAQSLTTDPTLAWHLMLFDDDSIW